MRRGISGHERHSPPSAAPPSPRGRATSPKTGGMRFIGDVLDRYRSVAADRPEEANTFKFYQMDVMLAVPQDSGVASPGKAT